jgi:hypothetical protein
MSDTSFYDSRVYQERMQTEALRQDAANLEIEYWNLRMQKERLKPAPAEPERIVGREESNGE